MPSATRIGGGLCATIAVESGLTTWGAPTGRLRTNASCGFRETTSSLTRRCRPTTLSPSRHLLRRCGRGWCTGVGMRWVVHGSLGPPPSFPANGPECRSDHSRATGHRARYVHPEGAGRDQVRTPCRGARSGTNLVLRSNSHLPVGWRERAILDWTWTFVLHPVDNGQRTRYHSGRDGSPIHGGSLPADGLASFQPTL